MKSTRLLLAGAGAIAALCALFVGCGGGGSEPSPGNFISGYVFDPAGRAISNATITLSHSTGANVIATTGGAGYYYFGSLAGSNYTVTPSLTGYAFNPAAAVVTPTATNVNFTASRFLSGYVRTTAGAGLSQVAVTLAFSGGSNLVIQTGTSGYYYLAGLPATNCTITPARAGYGFIPPTRDVVPSATNADFTAIKYVAGFVMDTAGVGVANATVSITNSAGSTVVVTTEATGYFYSGALADGQYTVTPSLAGFAFSPASLQVAPTVTNANFSAVRVTTPVFGLSFGAYLPGQSPAAGSVVTAEQMRRRLSAIAPFTKWVRSYAMDSGMENIGPIAHEMGLKTAIGA